jgi:hypothetical protein
MVLRRDLCRSRRSADLDPTKDENFDVIYFNSTVEPDEWRTFEVGETQFNDDALRRTGAYTPFYPVS